MAEIEMDVDLAPPPMKFDEHADEDLIDYDIDTTEDHGHDLWSSHQDEQLSSMPDHVHSTKEFVGTESNTIEAEKNNEHFQDMEADHPQDGVVYDQDDAIDESHHQPQAAAEMHQHNNSILEPVQSEDVKEAYKDEKADDTITTGPDNAVDEIDYDEGDVTVTQESESLSKADEGEDSRHAASSNIDTAATEDAAGTATAEPAGLPVPAEVSTGNTDLPETATKDDEDEITWEHEDEDDVAKHDDTEAAGAGAVETVSTETTIPPTSEGVYDHTETEPTQNSDSHEQAYEQHTNATDSDYDDTAMEASEDKENAVYQQDDSLSQAGESISEAHDFPAITVQYKGDEFPFFSQDRTEGFFSDLSILDHSMESVLAGFRAELENEVVAQDELVFQVDELGLEFAETTVQNSLATITLRQVLEVFDLLVKNQDPDSSRTLYTYLFTKPNASKRFEFLAESATAGRGLDEVIHLFESPLGHHHANAGAEHEHEHDEDSEANEIVGNQDSAEDDDGNDDVDAETGESEASEEDEEEEEEEEEDDDDDDDDEETSAVEDQQVETVDQYEEEEEEEEEDEEEDEDEEDFMGEAEDFIGDVDDNANQDGEYSDGADEGYKDEQLQPVVVEPVSTSGHTDANAEAENAPDATYSYDDEDDDADANPFIHLEMQESIVDNGGEVEYEEIAHVEVGDETSRQIPMHSIDEYIDTNELDTGTTNTLADNGEAISALPDLGTEQGLDEEITNEDLAFDEMPEIDWRDDLEPTDDAKNDIPTTPSGLAKRRRTEDEQGVEDEQDVKRRRP